MKKFIINGFISNALGRMISIIAPIILMKPMLNYLGEELFGAWMLATSLTTIGYFLISAINNTILTNLSSSFGRNDLLNKRIIIGQSTILNAFVSIFSLLFIFIVTFISIIFLYYSRESEKIQALIIVASALTALAISLNTQIVGTILNSEKKFFRFQIFQTFSSPLSVLLVLLATKLDVGRINLIHLYYFAPVALQALVCYFYFYIYEYERPIFKKFGFSDLQQIIKSILNFLILSLIISASMNIDFILLALWEGPAFIAEIGPPLRFGYAIQLVVAAFSMPLWSIYGEALAKSDGLAIKKATWQYGLLMFTITLIIGVTIVIFSNELMVAWMGQSFEYQAEIIAGTVALALAMSITAPHNMILNSQGMAKEQIAPWFFFLIATILLKVIALEAKEPWCLPWISAGCYILIITPIIVGHSKRTLKT